MCFVLKSYPRHGRQWKISLMHSKRHLKFLDTSSPQRIILFISHTFLSEEADHVVQISAKVTNVMDLRSFFINHSKEEMEFLRQGWSTSLLKKKTWFTGSRKHCDQISFRKLVLLCLWHFTAWQNFIYSHLFRQMRLAECFHDKMRKSHRELGILSKWT